MGSKTPESALIFAVVVATAGGLTSAQQLELSRYTIAGGGGMHSTGGGFELSGAIGQPGAGAMAGGAFELTRGFWFEEPPGDCDATGTVDLLDSSTAAACLSGPGNELDATACRCFDLDADGDHDLFDIARFQTSFTGN